MSCKWQEKRKLTKHNKQIISPLIPERSFFYGFKIPYRVRFMHGIFSFIMVIGALPFLIIGLVGQIIWLFAAIAILETILLISGCYNLQKAAIERREERETYWYRLEQYDEATNQGVSVHGIGFQIPKAGTKVVEDKDNLQYAD